MEALLAQLVDVGGPAFFLVLMFRFWPQFQDLLALAHRSAGWAADRLETFVDRTIVIMARKIWWVILPVQFVMTVASTISAWNIPGNGWWFSANFMAKVLALIASSLMAYHVSRVRHVPDGHGLTSQAAVNAAFGRPGLFVPMIMTAFFSLATLTSAMLSDTFMLADVVWFYHSMFSAILFILMLFFTVSFMVAGLFIAYAFSRLGIDLGASGLWSSVVVPLATYAIPGLTGQNNAGLKLTADDRTKLNQAAWDLLVDNRMAGGLMMAWVLFFISFHGPIAWVIELGLIIMLMACMLTYVWFIQKPMLRVAEIVTIFICTVGAVSFLLRLVDAAVLRGVGDHSVMFYERVVSLFAGLGSAGGLTCYAIGIPRAALVIIGVIALVIVVLAMRTDGKRSKLLFVVAMLIGLPVIGISIYRMTAPGSVANQMVSCGLAPASRIPHPASSEDGAESTDIPGASPSSTESSFLPTVVAGSHHPLHSCSLTDPSRPCAH